MPLSALLLLAASPALAQETKTFQDKEIGFTFTYPASWEFRKERLYSVFQIPLSDGRKAEVQLVNTPFRGKTDSWQQAQSDVAKTQGKQIEKQWEEVILGVPLLMTQLAYTSGDAPMTSLVGLLYARNPVKLSFRLAVPMDAYPEAEKQWRGVLNGLRTISGALPTQEDPTQPPTVPVAQPGSSKVVVLSVRDPKPAKPRKSDRVEQMDVLGQSLQLRLPRSWTLVKADSGYTLTHPKVAGAVKLDFGAGQFSDMVRAVVAASSAASSSLTTVKLREEGSAKTNRSGSGLYRIIRKGTTASGESATAVWGGHAGLYYWTTTFTSSSEKEFRSAGSALAELHDSLLLSSKG